jgi:hypothetical protein
MNSTTQPKTVAILTAGSLAPWFGELLAAIGQPKSNQVR